MSAGGPDDAIADEAGAVLKKQTSPSATAFDLSPVTLDRPLFYAALRLSQLRTILSRLEVLPQAEIAGLVNLAVLGQAVVIAALVLFVPLVAPRRLGAWAGAGLARVAVFFAALGLGFLFIEMYLIEQASVWLEDRITGFALVLTGMLVFSGLGSMASGRLSSDPRRNITAAVLIIAAWVAAASFGLKPLILTTFGLPWAVRALLVLTVAAPVSVALGLPFPLGLARIGPESALLPWAWSLNGAFSVLATPLASLIARTSGFDRVLLCAAALYLTALLAFTVLRRRTEWHLLPARSPGAD